MSKLVLVDDKGKEIHLTAQEALELKNKIESSTDADTLKHISDILYNYYNEKDVPKDKIISISHNDMQHLQKLLVEDENTSCEYFIILSYQIKLSAKKHSSWKELGETKLETVYDKLKLDEHFNKHSEKDYFDTVTVKKYELEFHHVKISLVKSQLYFNIMYTSTNRITIAHKLIHNFYIGLSKHWYKDPKEFYILHDETKYIVEFVNAKQPDVVITNDGMVYKKTEDKIKDIEDDDILLDDIVSPFQNKLGPAVSLNNLPLLPTHFDQDKVNIIRKYNDLAKSYYELGRCNEYKNLIPGDSLAYLQQHEIVQLYGPYSIYIYCYSVKQLFHLYKQRGYMFNPMDPNTNLSQKDKERIENLFILNGLHWRQSTLNYT